MSREQNKKLSLVTNIKLLTGALTRDVQTKEMVEFRKVRPYIMSCECVVNVL